MAFFLKVEAFYNPSYRATILRSIFQPFPQVMRLRGTVLRYCHSGKQRKGYLASFAFIPMALSSRPRLRIHNLSISNTISFYISSYPALLNAIRQREYPANIQSAPKPEVTILALVALLAKWSAAAILKSMWVDLGQIFLISSFFIFSISSIFLLSKIRLNWRLGFNDLNSSYDILPAYLSGASYRNAKFTRSICSSFGRVRSRSRAIRVESIPPEKSTAILAEESFTVQSYIPRMHLVISFTLSMSSFLTVAITTSKVQGTLCSPIFLRST